MAGWKIAGHFETQLYLSSDYMFCFLASGTQIGLGKTGLVIMEDSEAGDGPVQQIQAYFDTVACLTNQDVI